MTNGRAMPLFALLFCAPSVAPVAAPVSAVPAQVVVAGAGDGIADDTESIRSVLVAAGVNHAGATVYFPPGVYLVTDTVNVPSGIHLQGAGVDRANALGVIKYPGSTDYKGSNILCRMRKPHADCFHFMPSSGRYSDVSVERLAFLSGGYGAGNRAGVGLHLDGAQARLQQVTIWGFETGIKASGLVNSVFDQVQITGNTDYGFQFDPAGSFSTTVEFRSCYFGSGGTATHVYITNATSVAFYSSIFESTTADAIVIEGPSGRACMRESCAMGTVAFTDTHFERVGTAISAGHVGGVGSIEVRGGLAWNGGASLDGIFRFDEVVDASVCVLSGESKWVRATAKTGRATWCGAAVVP